jgi:hypothetical protein
VFIGLILLSENRKNRCYATFVTNKFVLGVTVKQENVPNVAFKNVAVKHD